MQGSRLQIILSEDEWKILEELTTSLGYRSYSECVRQLIRKESEKQHESK